MSAIDPEEELTLVKAAEALILVCTAGIGLHNMQDLNSRIDWYCRKDSAVRDLRAAIDRCEKFDRGYFVSSKK